MNEEERQRFLYLRELCEESWQYDEKARKRDERFLDMVVRLDPKYRDAAIEQLIRVKEYAKKQREEKVQGE